jgi:RimJ/RimL family protein N-acetyltransferase
MIILESPIKRIRTDRLVIRLAESGDEEAIYSYRSDFNGNKYQGWFPDSVERVGDYIKNMPSTIDIVDKWFQFVIITADENKIIGDIGVCFTGSDEIQGGSRTPI